MDRDGLLTTTYASVAHALSHMFVLFYATVVLVLDAEFALSYAELMSLSVPGAILFGAGALPAGWLADRWSSAGMIAIFFFGTGAAAIATGFAGTPFWLAMGLSAIGLFASIYHPVGIPWLIKHARNRGRALGVSGVFGSLGTAAAALVAGWLGEGLGWRAAFIVPGVITIAIGFLFVATLRAGWIVERAEDAVAAPAPEGMNRRNALLALAVAVICTGLIYQATSYALPKMFEERLFDVAGGSLANIGLMVTACYVVSGLTQLIGGELADRYEEKWVYAAAQVLQVPIYVIGFQIFGPALLGVAVLMIGLNVIGQPAENALVARYTPPRWRGQVFGVKFVLTLGVSAAGIAVLPVIHAAFGSFDPLWLMLAAAAAVGFIAAAILPSNRRSAARASIAAAE